MSKTVMCAARLPELLVARVDAAAKSASVSRAQFIAEACRQRLDGPIVGKVVSVGSVQSPDSLPPLPYVQVESTDYAGLERSKPDMQALRDICAGKIPCKYGDPTCPCPDGDPCHYEATETTPAMEIPICGKTWWEDGEQYECMMDAGHRELKHGMRGMVRKLDD